MAKINLIPANKYDIVNKVEGFDFEYLFNKNEHIINLVEFDDDYITISLHDGERQQRLLIRLNLKYKQTSFIFQTFTCEGGDIIENGVIVYDMYIDGNGIENGQITYNIDEH